MMLSNVCTYMYLVQCCVTVWEPLFVLPQGQQYILLQLVPETENGFHILHGHRTGTNMFYEWSLKKRCIR